MNTGLFNLKNFFLEKKFTIEQPFLLVFIISTIVIGLRTIIFGFPLPSTIDEYAHLLTADSLINLSLYGPGHVMPEFFETSFILINPTHASMYPIGQGFALALGEIFFGSPIYGVIIPAIILALCFSWLIEEITDNITCLLAGLFITMLIGMGYWARSYFGSCLFSIGICLIIGSYFRWIKEKKLCYEWLFALGCIIVFFTRTYEGAALLLAILLCTIYDITKNIISLKNSKKFFTVVTICALITLTFQGYYNYKTTGNIFTNTYYLYFKEFRVFPIFWFQDLNQPTKIAVTTPMKKLHYEAEKARYKDFSNNSFKEKFYYFLENFNEVFFQIKYWQVALPFLLIVGFDIITCRLLFITFFCTIASAFVTWQLNHYLANTIFCEVILTFYLIYKSQDKFVKLSKKYNFEIIEQLPKFLMIGLVFYCFFHQIHRNIIINIVENKAPGYEVAYYQKREFFDNLDGLNLVFIKYDDKQNFYEVWTNNESDIDAQKTVYANYLGRKKNMELIKYYKSIGQNRRAWVIDLSNNQKISEFK